MPFTSDLMGRFGENPLAIDIFALNLLLASAATQGVQLFAKSHHLQVGPVDDNDMRMGHIRAWWLVAVVCLTGTVAWFDSGVASYCWLLLIPSHRLAQAFARRFPADLDHQPLVPAAGKESG
jgi:hypothetical protein